MLAVQILPRPCKIVPVIIMKTVLLSLTKVRNVKPEYPRVYCSCLLFVCCMIHITNCLFILPTAKRKFSNTQCTRLYPVLSEMLLEFRVQNIRSDYNIFIAICLEYSRVVLESLQVNIHRPRQFTNKAFWYQCPTECLKTEHLKT